MKKIPTDMESVDFVNSTRIVMEAMASSPNGVGSDAKKTIEAFASEVEDFEPEEVAYALYQISLAMESVAELSDSVDAARKPLATLAQKLRTGIDSEK